MSCFKIGVFVAFLSAFGCVLGCADVKDEPIKKEILPNIIWLVAEDQSPHFFPMYGDSTIALPNLATLSKDGVVFNNAYAPVPVCAPTRSAIITGMYPTSLGTHNMRTYNAYSTENQPEINIPSYSPIVPQATVMFTQLLRAKGYYCSNNPKEDYNFQKLETAWDESGELAHWRKRKAGQPFFSVFNFNVCHESGIWRQGAESLFVDPKTIPVPPIFPDDSIVRHDLAVNYSNLKRMDDQVGIIIDQLKEDGLYENSIIFFYADHGGPFPRYKRALYETGTKVPMIIKFASNKKTEDFNDDLVNFIDLAPTVLSLSGIKPPSSMQGKALFGAFSDKNKRNYLFTTSDRFDGTVDRLRAVRSRNYKYIKNFNIDQTNALPVKYREQMPMMPRLRKLFGQGLLNEAQAKWFSVPKPEEELYDLRVDPYELINLADQEAVKDTLGHLREVLKDWIHTTKDLGQFPEKELMDKWLVDGKQPKLNSPVVEKTKKGVVITHGISDASILWRIDKDTVWRVYTDAISEKGNLWAKAVRIGYQESEEVALDP
ncbi:sulfatase [Spongiimicrobium sp. 3-5]|uniref:sulfatase family protein n=1 Tax=Spongiimicrobium sp. 3-5 TaxID=3332596 RepID=UPI00398091B6